MALTFAFTALFSRTTAVADKLTVDPTGTWKVIQYLTNIPSNFPEHALKLEQKEGALTGTLSSASTGKHKSHVKEWPLKEAKLQGDEIFFTVSHPLETGAGDITTTYLGRIKGDTIKGALKVEVMGQSFTRNWEAARLKDLPTVALNPVAPK